MVCYKAGESASTPSLTLCAACAQAQEKEREREREKALCALRPTKRVGNEGYVNTRGSHTHLVYYFSSSLLWDTISLLSLAITHTYTHIHALETKNALITRVCALYTSFCKLFFFAFFMYLMPTTVAYTISLFLSLLFFLQKLLYTKRVCTQSLKARPPGCSMYVTTCVLVYI